MQWFITYQRPCLPRYCLFLAKRAFNQGCGAVIACLVGLILVATSMRCLAFACGAGGVVSGNSFFQFE